MIKVSKTKLEGVLLVELECFKDHRGDYTELYNEKLYKEQGVPILFVTDSAVTSWKYVLRGIHGDQKNWKLVSCLYGEFYFVVVDCDEASPNFGTWESFVLSDKNKKQILVPPKYGTAHLVLSDMAIHYYKQSSYYEGMESQFTHKWNDERFNIRWPVKNPILSRRDEMLDKN